MLKKTLLGALLLSLSSATMANNWVAGASYMSMQDDILDKSIKLGAITGSIGYKFDLGNNFSVVPELRLGFGLGDDKIGDAKLEIKRFTALTVRGQYDFASGAYVYAAPSYANLDVKASAYGESDSDDSNEFGFGAGVGYNFNKQLGAEFSIESYDGTKIYSVGARYSF